MIDLYKYPLSELNHQRYMYPRYILGKVRDIFNATGYSSLTKEDQSVLDELIFHLKDCLDSCVNIISYLEEIKENPNDSEEVANYIEHLFYEIDPHVDYHVKGIKKLKRPLFRIIKKLDKNKSKATDKKVNGEQPTIQTDTKRNNGKSSKMKIKKKKN